MSTREQPPEEVQAALDADIPHVYSNDYQVGVTTSDVLLILARNGRAEVTVNLSYTVAKSLGGKPF